MFVGVPGIDGRKSGVVVASSYRCKVLLQGSQPFGRKIVGVARAAWEARRMMAVWR